MGYIATLSYLVRVTVVDRTTAMESNRVHIETAPIRRESEAVSQFRTLYEAFHGEGVSTSVSSKLFFYLVTMHQVATPLPDEKAIDPFTKAVAYPLTTVERKQVS